MKILHLISSGGMYGAEAVVLNLSRALNEHGESSVLANFANSSNSNLQLHERAVADGIESYIIPCDGQIDRSVLGQIRHLVKATGADIVHAHGYKADVYAALAVREDTCPLISTCHNWIDSNLLLKLYGMMDRYVLRRYSAVVAVSNEIKHRLLRAGVSDKKIHLIRNGISLSPFGTATLSLLADARLNGHPIVGLVGRLSTEKGIDLFLQAAVLVLKKWPETRFVVIGEGPERDNLSSLIDRLSLTEKIFLLGQRSDMPSMYASLDIMVSASRIEGLPMSLLEGMASRRPIIATAVGEVPTLITDQTGILVPPEDIASLASAIESLLNDPQKRARLGNAARQLIEKEYSAEHMMKDYLAIYESILPNSGLPHQ